ncbi:MAG: DNA polymerase, partial [Planctomycetales bacterium]
TLCKAFADDQDVHALVASQVNSVPLDQVTSSMRRQAKAVNFGIIYGQSPFGLAKNLGIARDAAEEFINNYFARYPGVQEFLAKTLEQARQNSYVKTILGRRRRIEGVRAEPNRHKNLPERTAINTIIQGSAADLIKKAMIAVFHRLRQENHPARMLLQIHDELVFETPATQLDGLAELVVEEMTTVLPLNVPLKVDASAGPNWFDLQAR